MRAEAQRTLVIAQAERKRPSSMTNLTTNLTTGSLPSLTTTLTMGCSEPHTNIIVVDIRREIEQYAIDALKEQYGEGVP